MAREARPFRQRKILKMQKENRAYGFRISQADRKACVECKLNKCKRVEHPDSPAPKANRTVATLHMDMMGPIKPAGIQDETHIIS